MHEQIIYFGAPGTGKSYLVAEKLKDISSDKIFRVTIHPEFTYSDFIGQLLPEENPETKSIEFPFKEGPFTKALKEAYSDFNEKVYLILEEISRGNVAAIFGDIFQLLDRDDYSASKYPIRHKNIAEKIVHITTDEIVLPSNFNIIGTVNINDQNVFPMDTAFKRRFDWEYVTSRPVVDESGNIISKLNNPKLSIYTNTDLAHPLITNWQSFYSTLNIFITDNEKGLGKSEDKQIGQFFIDFSENDIKDSHSGIPEKEESAKEKINNKIKNKLLLYLWQDVQGSLTFSSNANLFAQDIKSFDDLYEKYGKEQIFSDDFIHEFLEPNVGKYVY